MARQPDPTQVVFFGPRRDQGFVSASTRGCRALHRDYRYVIGGRDVRPSEPVLSAFRLANDMVLHYEIGARRTTAHGEEIG